ncbi:MAG: P-II family nitrogen regulator [Longimicrobiales bacterium]
MADRDVVVLTDVMLVTCVVQKSMADEIVRACRDAGAEGATVYYARGSGVRERLGVLGVAVEVEKEVINVVVATDQMDRIVEVMYLTGKLDVPGMGILYVTRLEKAATHVPENLLRRIREREERP